VESRARRAIEIDSNELSAIHLLDRHQRVYKAVSLFESAILNDKRERGTMLLSEELAAAPTWARSRITRLVFVLTHFVAYD
jgi:hypothetical protein